MNSPAGRNHPRINSRSRTFLKRALLLAGFCVTLTHGAFAASTLPFYEPFPTSYGEGNLGGGTSATVWDFGNSATSSSGRTTAAAALAYPGLITEPVESSEGIRSNPAGSGTKNRGATLTMTAGTTVYASFLLNLRAITNVTRPIFGFSTSGGSGSSVSANGAVVYLDSAGRLLVAKNSSTPAAATTYSLSLSNTYLVVIRYQFNTASSSDDEVALWLDPTPLGNNASIPTPSLSTTNNADVTSLGSIAYFQASSFPPLFYIDEVRVATDWAGVTPPPNSPGTTYSVTGGGLICSSGTVPIGLTGSDVGVDYLMYTNGVPSDAIVAGTGSAISFGPQSETAVYTVLASNTVSGDLGWMSGAAQVTALAGATLVTPPAAITVAANGLGAFTVVAAGDGLFYQWQRDGTNLVNGGNISGSTTPNLVINPATAADAATAIDGYSVIVTNQCTSAQSDKVGLTIDSPANLVWSGDGVSNLWDAGVSANWNNNTAVFHFGDNVTFDDTGLGFNVDLASSYLSPSSIVVNSTVDYIFGGSGMIVGSSSLVKDGAGTLTIANANSFVGGTVISNGVIALGSNEANSTGTNSGLGSTGNLVTFRGGTLQLFGYSGSTSPNYSTFRNPLVVPVGETGTLRMFSRGPANTGANSGLASSLTGGGTLNLVVNYLRDNLDGDWSAFTGLINVTSKNSGGDEMRINNNFGYANAAIFLNDFVLMDRVTTANAIIDIGELGGSASAIVGPGNTTAANPTWRVGWKNTTATFAGSINDDGVTSVIKVGTGKWILTGINGYTGSTIISNGVLALGDGITEGSIYGTTNIEIAANAILDLSSLSVPTVYLNSLQTLKGSGTVLGSVDTTQGGTIAPGSPDGILTVTNAATLGGTTVISLNRNHNPRNGRLVAKDITYGGNLVIANLGAPLQVNDVFDLFDWTSSINGSFANIELPMNYYTWDTSQLLIDGTIRVSAVLPFPTIATFSIDGIGNLSMVGTNGAPFTGYSILTSTNVAAPLSTWTPIGSGTFEADGTFNFTTPVSVEGQSFYILGATP